MWDLSWALKGGWVGKLGGVRKAPDGQASPNMAAFGWKEPGSQGKDTSEMLPCGFCVSWRWYQADSSVSDVLFGLVGASPLLCLPGSHLPAPEASLDLTSDGRDEGGSCHAAASP